MTSDNRVITAIDIGTTKVCTMVGKVTENNKVVILAYNTVPCHGLHKGNVVDIEMTTSAIKTSVKEVETVVGFKIDSAFVGVTGSNITFENRKDKIDALGPSGVITKDDLRRAPQSASYEPDTSDRQVIHAIRTAFSVDGAHGIRNPLGMHSKNVEVETRVVTGSAANIDKLTKAVEAAGIKLNGLVLEPLAAGMAVLKNEEKEQGAVVIDVGGEVTDIVGFKNGQICFMKVIPVGGYHFTNDIALTLRTTFDAAEEAKVKYANTETYIPGAEEEFSIPVVDRNVKLKVRRLDVCRVTRERAIELVKLIRIKLDESEMVDPAITRVVLTGGTANLPGLGPMLQKQTGLKVRLGIPDCLGEIPNELRNPSYATSVGMLFWAAYESGQDITKRSVGTKYGSDSDKPGSISTLLGRVGRPTRRV